MDEIDETDAVLEAMITHAIRAGGLRKLAAGNPDAARGLLLSADWNSDRAATLARELCEEAGRLLIALASPHPAFDGQ